MDNLREDRELQKPHTGKPSLPKWSVIIPTKNRQAQIERLLITLVKQEPPPREIIIVDQSERPAHLEWVLPRIQVSEALSFIYIHDSAIDGAAAARNVGFARSTGRYVIFLDDDAQPEPRCLQLLLEALEHHPNLLAAGGLIVNYVRPRFVIRLFRRVFYLGPLFDERQPVYWEARRYQPGQLIRTTKLNGGCMAFRREAITSIEGFDPRYRGASIGKDIEISQRLLRCSRRVDALALVGGALIHHESHGEWKRNSWSLQQEVVATHYWFKKNHAWNLPNRLRFWWMCLGLLLWSVASSLKRASPIPLVRFWAGVRTTLEDYRGCSFLREDGARGPVPVAARQARA